MPASAAAPGFRADLLRWRQLVAPAWLAALLAGDEVAAAPAPGWRLFEVGCGVAALFEQSHIPTAEYVDTGEIECAPLWNKVDDAELLRVLLARGVQHDSTVIVYGRNNLAAARLAQLLLYAGVEDVRLLDGGYALWLAEGHPCESVSPATAPLALSRADVATTFGARLPLHPEFLCDTGAVRALLAQPRGSLVSIRTEAEFMGRESGYDYIAARGDIPGALWGRAGVDGDVNSMSAYHDADGRMKSSVALRRQWAAAGIVAGEALVFYCGTGWRASMAFFYAWLMGWPHISVYDGGWLEWSGDAANPRRQAGSDPGAARTRSSGAA